MIQVAAHDIHIPYADVAGLAPCRLVPARQEGLDRRMPLGSCDSPAHVAEPLS
jgi:hypothetical protein